MIEAVQSAYPGFMGRSARWFTWASVLRSRPLWWLAMPILLPGMLILCFALYFLAKIVIRRWTDVIRIYSTVFREMFEKEKANPDETDKNENLKRLKKAASNRFTYYDVWFDDKFGESFERIRVLAPMMGWVFRPHSAIIKRLDTPVGQFNEAMAELFGIWYEIRNYIKVYDAYIASSGDDEVTGEDIAAVIGRFKNDDWWGADDEVAYSLNDGGPV